MRIPVLIAALLVLPAALPAAEPVLELSIGDVSYVGRPVAHNDHICWLAHEDGRLSRLEVGDVTSFRKVSDEFRGMTPLQARNHLRRQFGPGWEIVGTGNYLVCTATPHGRQYAQHFEDIYRSFRKYFTQRGFDLPQPEFPLIAVVFANQREFAAQCREDQVQYIPGLRGYYNRRTNRICLFEQDGDFARLDVQPGMMQFSIAAAATPPFAPSLLPSLAAWPERPVGSEAFDANFEGSLKDTIVHEATHQIAFNLGLHSRIGDPPRWMIEGLATMFEAEGTRRNTGGSAAATRVNAERLWWFNKYRQERRKAGSLAEFVAAEKFSGGNVLDLYAEAWALTFFLAETRPRQYTAYLRRVADRDPLQSYTSLQRLEDFQAEFGSDLSRLEVDLLRFIDALQ
jgi:hypothetical protein